MVLIIDAVDRRPCGPLVSKRSVDMSLVELVVVLLQFIWLYGMIASMLVIAAR